MEWAGGGLFAPGLDGGCGVSNHLSGDDTHPATADESGGCESGEMALPSIPIKNPLPPDTPEPVARHNPNLSESGGGEQTARLIAEYGWGLSGRGTPSGKRIDLSPLPCVV